MFVCFYIPTFNPKTKKNSPPKFQDLPTAELVKNTLHKAIDNPELGHNDFQQRTLRQVETIDPLTLDHLQILNDAYSQLISEEVYNTNFNVLQDIIETISANVFFIENAIENHLRTNEKWLALIRFLKEDYRDENKIDLLIHPSLTRYLVNHKILTALINEAKTIELKKDQYLCLDADFFINGAYSSLAAETEGINLFDFDQDTFDGPLIFIEDDLIRLQFNLLHKNPEQTQEELEKLHLEEVKESLKSSPETKRHQTRKYPLSITIDFNIETGTIFRSFAEYTEKKEGQNYQLDFEQYDGSCSLHAEMKK